MKKIGVVHNPFILYYVIIFIYILDFFALIFMSLFIAGKIAELSPLNVWDDNFVDNDRVTSGGSLGHGPCCLCGFHFYIFNFSAFAFNQTFSAT